MAPITDTGSRVALRVESFPSLHPRELLAPEQRLMLAVLEDAIQACAARKARETPRARRLRRDAERWLGSDDRDWVFSFRRICDELGLDPAWIRRRLWLATDRHQPISA